MLGAGVYTATPQPPYQGLVTELAFVSFEIDPAAVRPFVPPQLAISSSNIVQLAIFECGTAWGLGQHARAVFGLEVEDHDSPDTNKGMFMVAQAISGDAWSIINSMYGRADRGFARVRREGDTVEATVTGSDGAPWLELALRVSGPLMQNNSGIDRYIGETADGLVQHDVAYAATAEECEVERFEFAPGAPATFLACMPSAVRIAGVNPTFAGSYSVPWPLTANRDNQTISSYLDLMETDGRAAAVFSIDGRLLRANAKGMRLLQQVSPSAASVALNAAVRGRPVQLERTSGPPLLVRANLFRLPGTIDDLVLVLLIDLADPDRRAATPFLQLLGLTGAEASIAELVGSGLSARDAATALRLSENTVRSTLKAIYDKLDISKQSELARLLARFQF